MALLALVAVGCSRSRQDAASPANAFVNGDLSEGSGDTPKGWQSSPAQPGLSRLRWNRPQGDRPGELEIDNIQPNDAHWSQTVHLKPGWYHFTTSIRAEGVPSTNAGANLSAIEDGIISVPLVGTTDWQTAGFYLRVGKGGAEIALACRLGGFSSPNAGKAFCRDLKGTKIDEPPANAGPRYDLDQIRGINGPVRTAQEHLRESRRLPAAGVTDSTLKHIQPAAGSRLHASRFNVALERLLDLLEWTLALAVVAAALVVSAASGMGRLTRGLLRPKRGSRHP